MWIQALAVAAGAVPVPCLRDVPVVVAVGGVAVLAESRVVVEPGGMDLGEAQGRPERLGDVPGLAGVEGIAVAVVGGDAFEQQPPLSGLALPLDAGPDGGGPLLSHSAGSWPGATSSMRVDRASQTAHGGVTTIGWAICAHILASCSCSQARACGSSP